MNWNTRKLLGYAALAMAVLILSATGLPYVVFDGGDVQIERTDPVVSEADAIAPIVAAGLGLTAVHVGAGAADYFGVGDRDTSGLSDSDLKTLIAADAYTIEDNRETFLTDTRNTEKLSDQVVLAKARDIYANERAAGANHSDALVTTKSKVSQLYAKQQISLGEKFEKQMAGPGSVCQMDEEYESILSDSTGVQVENRNGNGPFTHPTTCNMSSINTYSGAYYDGISSSQASPAPEIQEENMQGELVGPNGTQPAINLTLTNGTHYTFETVGYDSGGTPYVLAPMDSGSNGQYVKVNDPDGGDVYIEVTPETADSYGDAFYSIRQSEVTMQDRLGNASSGYLADLDRKVENNDNLTWEDVGQTYQPLDCGNSTDSQQDCYVRSLAPHSDGPPTGTTMTIEWTANNTTQNETGKLFVNGWAPSTDPDNDSTPEWVVGETYDGSQGMTQFVADDGTLYSIPGNFTVVSITSPSGESVSQIDHEDTTIDTVPSNDELEKLVEKKVEEYTEVKEQTSDGGGGPILPGIGGSSGMGIVLIAVAVFIALVGGSGGGSMTFLREDGN